jgi:CrcB protein
MLNIILVAVGGALGSVLRHLVNLASLPLFGPAFPWGTAAVNVVGSFVMGAFIELLARRFGASSELRLFVATGVLGGFTTFSAFSLDFAVLWERGAATQAIGYAAGSVIVSLLALFAGLWFVRSFG